MQLQLGSRVYYNYTANVPFRSSTHVRNFVFCMHGYPWAAASSDFGLDLSPAMAIAYRARTDFGFGVAVVRRERAERAATFFASFFFSFSVRKQILQV